ncbi:hypothetical protein J1G44_16935 [Cellulomonas sp. zg-ZUI199]|uniref:DUF5666 domain-containing protein n=1 Tax=Cellulomonas wangleii TaxID=2816956 RepID=A0ABX8D5F6_9CELL|nr:hypothetical protein [Cellulomonas wangleii]MBO0926162.1 hypothetical protein [Cellulomonas wangleii]QVI62675.1 hypothetical protein KG103_01650 [Cellulomonas wangleii]
MSVRARLAVPVLLVVLIGGCATSSSPGASGLPGRSAEVTGTVAEQALTGASDAYYEGMPLRLAEAVVVDADGAPVDAVADGDEIEVWIGDSCRESLPVQCDIVAVQVVG